MPPNYLLNLTGKYIEASADNEVLPTWQVVSVKGCFQRGLWDADRRAKLLIYLA
jgi:hypothetical protein